MGWFHKGQKDAEQNRPLHTPNNITSAEREQYQKGVAAQKAAEERKPK